MSAMRNCPHRNEAFAEALATRIVPCLNRSCCRRDVHVLEMGSGHWLEPAPASGSGPAARAFHCAAVVGGAMFIFGGHVYVKEKKGLQKFDDLWRLNTVGHEAGRKSALPLNILCCPQKLRSSDLHWLAATACVPPHRPQVQIWCSLTGCWVNTREQCSCNAAQTHGCSQESWEWRLVTTSGDAKPVARDFAKLAELPGGQLLLFGGLDASERRLDDAWVLDTARWLLLPCPPCVSACSNNNHERGTGTRLSSAL